MHRLVHLLFVCDNEKSKLKKKLDDAIDQEKKQKSTEEQEFCIACQKPLVVTAVSWPFRGPVKRIRLHGPYKAMRLIPSG